MNKTIENLSSAIREIAAQEAEKHSDIVIGEIAEKNSDGTYDVFIVPDFVTPVTNIPNSSIYDFNVGEGCYIRKYNNQLQSSAIVDKIGPSEPRFGKGGEGGLIPVSGSIDVGKTSELQNDGSDGIHPFIDTSALLQTNPAYDPSTAEDKIFSAKAVSAGFTFLIEQVSDFAETTVQVNKNQDFNDSQKEKGRTNIGAASQESVDGLSNTVNNCVQVVEQTFTSVQQEQARTNIGAASQADCVQTVSQTFTEEQKTQARTNIGAITSSDVKKVNQRMSVEADLNTLANFGEAAYFSRYDTSTANTPVSNTYGNILSMRNSAGELTQLAMEALSSKIYYRSTGSWGTYGTWREADTIVQKDTNYIVYASGLKIQWGNYSGYVEGASGQEYRTTDITFPLAFSNTNYTVVVTNQNDKNNSYKPYSASPFSRTTTGMTVGQYKLSTSSYWIGFNYIAIGW